MDDRELADAVVMNNVGGHCGKCGAPYFSPTVWHGVTPPPVTPSCQCWNQGKVVTTNGITVTEQPTKESE